MDLVTLVIDAYDAARSRGQSRASAIFRALSIYRAHHPELPADEAGRAVVRILLHASMMAHAVDQGGARHYRERGAMTAPTM